MKKFGFATLIASGLTAAVLGFAVPALASIVASPIGAPGYHVDNHDNLNTTNGLVDVPFLIARPAAPPTSTRRGLP